MLKIIGMLERMRRIMGMLKDEFYKEIERIRFEEGSADEVFERREQIRKDYQGMSLEYREIYKWYFFYQLCNYNENLKGALWTYICDEHLSIESGLNVYLEYSKLLSKRVKIKKQIEESLKKDEQ